MSGQHCENYNVKWETVHCYVYLQNIDGYCTWSEVARCCRWNLIAIFKICFCFVLLYNKSLVPWWTVNFVSLESQCFSRLRLGKHWDSQETKFTALRVNWWGQIVKHSENHSVAPPKPIWKTAIASIPWGKLFTAVSCWCWELTILQYSWKIFRCDNAFDNAFLLFSV